MKESSKEHKASTMKHSNRHPAEILAEQTANRYSDMQLHGWRNFTGTLVLADFLAAKGTARACIWQAASADNRRGLVLQALRARDVAFDSETVEAFINHYNTRFTVSN